MNYEEIISKEAQNVPFSGIRKFFDIAAEMKDCISLGVGEPDFNTPKSFCRAGIESIENGNTHYTSNSGLLELRQAIAKYLKHHINLEYNPKTEILVTVGASEGIDLALRMLINPGDEVLVPSPCYVSYEPSVCFSHGIPVPINCKAKNSFKLTPEDLEEVITEKTKAIILAFPNNPTGAIMERPYLEAIAPILKKHNIIVISDEIYSELTYGEKHTSIAEIEGMRERTIIISGFSKAYAMTGWRLGYIAAPPAFLSIMRKIHQYTIMCAPTASQYVGLTAIEQSLANDFEEVHKMRDEYNKRRIYILNRLEKMGLSCFEPRGAFYVFPCVKSTGLTGEEFAEKLLYAKKVAVVPGTAFGSCGKYFVRISYAYSLEKIKIAFDKIEEFINELK